MTLADAVVRRTPLGVLGYPGDGGRSRGGVVGNELNWSATENGRNGRRER